MYNHALIFNVDFYSDIGVTIHYINLHDGFTPSPTIMVLYTSLYPCAFV